jgi:hypothetical protein
MAYAERTTVTAERSLGEMRELLSKHGCTHFAYGSSPEGDVIQFRLNERHYRMDVVRPTWDEVRKKFADPRRADQKAAVAGEWRRRWRARVLWLKATLEFAENSQDIARMLMAYSLLPDGRTLEKALDGSIEEWYLTGKMPPLLGAGLDIGKD